MHTVDLLASHARAVRATVPLVARVLPPDLSLPTPCAEWDLGHLLAHMTAQHRGFAAAAAGRGGDLDIWRPQALGDDPGREYAQAAESVIAAFAEPDVLDRDLLLPEITSTPIPGRLVIGFHLVDYVVHGWDVARTLGIPYELPPDVLAVALPIAEAVPDGETRLTPDAAFAPRLPDPGEDPLDRILALLGRDPGKNVVPRR
ncbi:TIGR03086 family protein [Actinoplanes sp. ATCC 53533]|uniref:TIGR03086 family metal-binding protein n=1 Tax=Actinoplanes sp. ATCC 53533 TaxID=1288362 RepID=UPI000F7B1CD2|nr:TIGR03086 family metal-binding protein [Actinoplanes sp. ATCC 53533]RSM53833.1 TIGR03086 family protein [Actinoplanes sp. ATCC 53533]